MKRGQPAFLGPCAKARGLKATWWWQYSLRKEKTKGQEDSVLADSFIRKISEAKGTPGNIVIGKSILLKNFYKWKLFQVQAIFKNTTTWVAGRRVTAVFKYFSERMNTFQTSFSCLSRGPEVALCGSYLCLDRPPALSEASPTQ